MKILLIGSDGYIGRVLTLFLRTENVLDRCDIGWHKDPRSSEMPDFPIYKDFNNIKEYTIKKYDCIILLAAHSSVGMCQNDMVSSCNNNVRNFWNLIDKLGANQPLIYASSGSVYGNGEGHFYEHSPLPPATNWYDFSKQEIDRIALASGKKVYGLRFGTVNGASPNFRPELMLNSMYLSARTSGVVKYKNEKSSRAILGMKDLTNGVGAILKYIEKRGPKNPGVYNLASFNSTVGYMANQVAHKMEVPLLKEEDSPTYSFQLNCQKFQQVFDWAPEQNINDILDDLIWNYGKMDHKGMARDRMIKYE